MESQKRLISLVISAILLFLPSIARYSYGDDIILCPPASPALGENGKADAFISDDGHFLGYIPASIKTGGYSRLPRALGLPDLFDLRNEGTLTPVKSQGSCGSCWAFGTYGSLESVLLTGGWGNYNLSEENLKECHGFNWGGCSGGNGEISTAYLSRLSGPVAEEDDPYHDYNRPCNSSLTPQVWVTEARYLPGNRDIIKQAVFQHGAVFTSYYHSGSYYNVLYRTYYYYGTAPANHGVAIVGWDDNKSTAAPDPGAWIIKNSWGTGFGESGFFYISYYDFQILSENVQWLGVRPYPQDVKMYLWDEHGMTCMLGNGSDIGWGANRFVPIESGVLKEVAFYTNRMDTMVEIYIYDVFDGTNMKYLLGPKTVAATGYAGYFTIALDEPIVVTQGDDFIVAMRFETPDYEYPVPIEMAKDDVNGKLYVLPDIEPNVSYRSYDGITWGETTSNGLECNVCIRALVYPRESSCDFDVDHDRDVDGSDLANFAIYFNPEKLADFAASYGRVDCPCFTEQAHIKGYSNSGCLDMSKGSFGKYPGCGEDEIIARVEGNTIFVTHMNATYNCCPDDIEVKLSSQGSILRLDEKEILTTPCDCMCCYNIYTEIAGLTPGEYTIEVCWQDWETHGKLCRTVEVVVP